MNTTNKATITLTEYVGTVAAAPAINPAVLRLLELARNIKPRQMSLTPASTTPPTAKAGEVWFVTEYPGEPDYSPLNPYISVVIILSAEDGEPIVRVAPIVRDLKYSGVSTAIFPDHVFGGEAGVCLGCEASMLREDLVEPIGVLPEKWMDSLAMFARWMNDEGDFPEGLQTGRPFTHREDPGYIYEGNLCSNMQHLIAPALARVLQ